MQRSLARTAILAALLSISLGGAAPPARAAPQIDTQFIVNTTADWPAAQPLTDGFCDTTVDISKCSLRAAITKANHYHLGSVDIFLPGLPAGQAYYLTIPPQAGDDENSGDLNVTFSAGRPSVTIVGDGAANTIIDASGMVPGDRVLSITTSVIVAVSGVTIQGGKIDSDGAGIHNSGTLTLTNSRVTGNRIVTTGFVGGAIFNDGPLTLINSTISDSQADEGGGIYNDRAALRLVGSTLSGNSVGFGGGGLLNSCGTAVFVNSTISGNHGLYGGGIDNTAAGCGSTLKLYNATIALNTVDIGGIGGGINNDNLSTVDFQNTILSNNQFLSASFSPSDCTGTLTSLGYNLISSLTSDCHLVGDPTGNHIDQFALLRPLGDYGGPTQTHALNPTSPAINAGNPAGCLDDGGGVLAADQRGYPRPRSGCDIGAFELDHEVDLPLVRK